MSTKAPDSPADRRSENRGWRHQIRRATRTDQGNLGPRKVRELSYRIAGAGEWALFAAFLLTPLTTLRPGTSITFGDCLLALVLAIAVVLVVLRRRLPVALRWVWIGTALLFVSIATVEVFPPVSLEALIETFSGTPYGSSIAGAARLMAALVVFPVAVATVVQRWVTIGLLVNAWIVGVSISCGVAVIDAAAGTGLQASLANNPSLVSDFLGLEPARYVGLSVHPTSFSVSVAMASPLVLGKMTDSGRVLRFSPLFLLFAFGVILSGSRGGLVGMALAIVLTIALNSDVRHAIFSKRPTVLLIIVAELAACTALLLLGTPRPDPVIQPTPGTSKARAGADGNGNVSRIDPFGDSAQVSNAEREKLVEESLDYVAERPVPGYGFQWIEASHSIYLQLLLSGGLIALLGYVLVIGGYFREGIRLRSRVPGYLRGVDVSLMISMAVFLVMGLFQTDLLDRYLYLPVALILSMSALLRRSESEASSDENHESQR